jgi:hypothetical protein
MHRDGTPSANSGKQSAKRRIGFTFLLWFFGISEACGSV